MGTKRFQPDHSSREPRSHQDGFTLLEVMIALAIIALSLTAIFGSQSQSLSLNGEAQFMTRASMLAQAKLAQYRSGIVALESEQGDCGEEFPELRFKAEVREVDDSRLHLLQGVEEQLFRVEVTIFSVDTVYAYSLVSYIQEGRRL